MSIITKEWAEKFEKAEYFDEILNGLEEIKRENNYTEEEMENDLDVALWKAYIYNNMDTYEYYELSEKTLAKVKDKGIKSGVWCYRYSCALVYLRRFEEALNYSRLGTEVEPDYPWGWLQLGRICYKFNLLDEAYKAIEKGLELVPNNYEFLTLKDDIDNDRGYAYANSHYIDEIADKTLEKKLTNIDDEELYNQFLNKNEVEKKLDILHTENKNQEIIDLINSLSEEELNYEILGRLARAYNNSGEYEKGKEILLKTKDEGKDTALWNFRIGYSCYFMDQLEEAKDYFEKCLRLNPEEPDGELLLKYTYSDLATKKFEEGKEEEGLKYFELMKARAKNNDDIIFVESKIAWVYDHVDNFEKGYEHLLKAVELGRDDIWIHSEMGCCLGGLNRYKEAIEEFKKAEDMGRDDVWIYVKLGLLYRETEDYDKALEKYLKVLELDPEDVYVISEVAWIYDNIKDDIETGLKYLLKAKKLGRDDAWINSEIGWGYNHLSEHKKALTHLKKAKKQGRDDEWINFEFGYALARMDRVDEALKYFNKAIEMGKDDLVINTEVGYWLDSVERYSEALPHLQKVFEYDKNGLWINSELGYCLNRLNRYEEALLYIEKAIELGRNDSWIFIERGYSLKNLIRYEEALESYLKAEELGKEDEVINIEISECLENLGRIDEAINRLHKNLLNAKDANKVLLNSQLGYLYGRQNKPEEALNCLFEAEKEGRNDVWIYSEIGWNLAGDLKRYQEALEYFYKAIELGRDDIWIDGQIGFVLSRLNQDTEAVKYFEKAMFIDPTDNWIRYQLASSYRKSGEIEKALKLLNSLLENSLYKGWVEFELAWCYALIDEKEKAKEYLKEADLYIGSDIVASLELKRDYDTIKKLISMKTYLA